MKFRAFFGEKETQNSGFNFQTVFKFKDPSKSSKKICQTTYCETQIFVTF